VQDKRDLSPGWLADFWRRYGPERLRALEHSLAPGFGDALGQGKRTCDTR
jgi:hypothetical protein